MSCAASAYIPSASSRLMAPPFPDLAASWFIRSGRALARPPPSARLPRPSRCAREAGERYRRLAALARQVHRPGAAELHDRPPPLRPAVAPADRPLLLLAALNVQRH